MAFSNLFKGIIGQFTNRFTNWTNQMNQNLRRINMREGGIHALEQVATFADLPTTPNNGDTYIVTSTKTVWTWYEISPDPGFWESTALYVPDIFWDEDQNKFYFYNGTSIVELLTASIPAPNVVYSTSCGSFSTNSTTAVSVTNLLGTIVTSGNNVDVSLVADGVATSGSYISITNSTPTGTEARGYINILRDSVIITKLPLYLNTGATTTSLTLQIPPCGIVISELLPAGSYDYEVQAYIDGTVDTDQLFQFEFIKLKLHEIR